MVGNNISILLTVLIGVGLSMLTISSISFLGLTESFSQTTETQSKSPSFSLHITKHSSNSYALSSSSSHIGSFDTTYNILGSVSSIKDSKDLITSTIINDYDNLHLLDMLLYKKVNHQIHLNLQA